MIKTPPSPARLAALIGFVLACVLTLTYLWIGFGGSIPFAPRGYRIEVAFPQANELAGGADVRIAGVNVGTVVGLKLDKQDSRTLATIQIARQYAPLPTDTRATLRIKTLLGETYVELSTGDHHDGNLSDGGRIPDGQVAPDVTLDQILSTFDPTTRRAFETWMQSQAGAVVGRGEDINESFGNLPGFVDSGNKLLAELNGQSAAVRGLVANTGQFFNAISARRGELSGLITAANSLFTTTAQRNQDLADVFKALPRVRASEPPRTAEVDGAGAQRGPGRAGPGADRPRAQSELRPRCPAVAAAARTARTPRPGGHRVEARPARAGPDPQSDPTAVDGV